MIIYRTLNGLLFIILYTMASIAIASLTAAIAVSHSGTRIREQFTYTPKGRHRKLV